MTQDVNVPDNDQPDVVAEMLAAARASRGTVDGSPYSSGRQDEIDERQYANEWQMAAADAAHDEIQALRVVARTRANDSAYSAWMTAQWLEARRKQHAAEARAVDAERQLAEALKDSAYEHGALMAAQARIAELEAAVRIAEPAPIERAGPDLATAHAITAHDPTFWYRRCTLLERERAELCAQVARLEAAGGDKPAAAAPAEPPAPDDDEPTLASLGDRKAQQRRAVDVPPLKRKPVNDLPDVA